MVFILLRLVWTCLQSLSRLVGTLVMVIVWLVARLALVVVRSLTVLVLVDAVRSRLSLSRLCLVTRLCCWRLVVLICLTTLSLTLLSLFRWWVNDLSLRRSDDNRPVLPTILELSRRWLPIVCRWMMLMLVLVPCRLSLRLVTLALIVAT